MNAFAAIRENGEDINNAIESIFVRCQSCVRNGRHFEMLLHSEGLLLFCLVSLDLVSNT